MKSIVLHIGFTEIIDIGGKQNGRQAQKLSTGYAKFRLTATYFSLSMFFVSSFYLICVVTMGGRGWTYSIHASFKLCIFLTVRANGEVGFKQNMYISFCFVLKKIGPTIKENWAYN